MQKSAVITFCKFKKYHWNKTFSISYALCRANKLSRKPIYKSDENDYTFDFMGMKCQGIQGTYNVNISTYLLDKLQYRTCKST